MTPEVIYGVQPVLEALRAEGVAKVYLGRGGPEADAIRLLAQEKRVPVVHTPPDALARLTGTSKHQGVAALQSAQKPYDLDALITRCKKRENDAPFLFVLDGVEDPRNLGAIIRTADAAGADGVIIPNRRAAGITGIVAKTSAGALAHLPVATVTNLSNAMDRLKQENIWLVGLSAESKTCYWDFDFTLPVALALGGEGGGLHQKVRGRCDALLSLPMRGHVASLNVSVAAALAAYEVVRQRSCGRQRASRTQVF
jgi:23S rRNA (guanosine2251-2'-O)-methyltransferase